MKSSTRDRAKGRAGEVKGKIKERTGRAIGNPDLATEGTVEKVGGKIRRKAGEIKRVFED